MKRMFRITKIIDVMRFRRSSACSCFRYAQLGNFQRLCVPRLFRARGAACLRHMVPQSQITLISNNLNLKPLTHQISNNLISNNLRKVFRPRIRAKVLRLLEISNAKRNRTALSITLSASPPQPVLRLPPPAASPSDTPSLNPAPPLYFP